MQQQKQVHLQSWFDAYINELHDKGRLVQLSHRTTINSLNLYKKVLHLRDVTPALLEDYEKHLTDAGKSYTTVSIYIRQLRAIINQAINANVLSAEKYPFKKYEIPSGRNVKESPVRKDIQKF
ncbi:MAG: phage integrase SAM-like domain-containing protein [Chitinophagaceae bacterium]|nr:phage integrase SAM-like domain-containing protein [Chitinophagaceae bacterium]